jgi:hypothetical protein
MVLTDALGYAFGSSARQLFQHTHIRTKTAAYPTAQHLVVVLIEMAFA